MGLSPLRPIESIGRKRQSCANKTGKCNDASYACNYHQCNQNETQACDTTLCAQILTNSPPSTMLLTVYLCVGLGGGLVIMALLGWWCYRRQQRFWDGLAAREAGISLQEFYRRKERQEARAKEGDVEDPEDPDPVSCVLVHDDPHRWELGAARGGDNPHHAQHTAVGGEDWIHREHHSPHPHPYPHPHPHAHPSQPHPHPHPNPRANHSAPDPDTGENGDRPSRRLEVAPTSEREGARGSSAERGRSRRDRSPSCERVRRTGRSSDHGHAGESKNPDRGHSKQTEPELCEGTGARDSSVERGRRRCGELELRPPRRNMTRIDWNKSSSPTREAPIVAEPQDVRGKTAERVNRVDWSKSSSPLREPPNEVQTRAGRRDRSVERKSTDIGRKSTDHASPTRVSPRRASPDRGHSSVAEPRAHGRTSGAQPHRLEANGKPTPAS